MSCFSNRLTVTVHAHEQWLRRAATFGNDHVEDVCAAVRASRLVAAGDFLPLPRIKGSLYLHHAAANVYFVLCSVSADHARVISVVPAIFCPPRRYKYRIPREFRRRHYEERRDDDMAAIAGPRAGRNRADTRRRQSEEAEGFANRKRL